MQYVAGAWDILKNALLDNDEMVFGARTYLVTEKRSVYIGYYLNDSIPKCIQKSKEVCIVTLNWVDVDCKPQIDYGHEVQGVDLTDYVSTLLPINTPCFSVRITWQGKHYHYLYDYCRKRP
jgi:hypothetical protein